MKIVICMLLGAVFFAGALLSSAWFLKNNPLGDWVDAFLYVGLGCFLAIQTFPALPQVFAPQHRRS